MVIFNSYVKLPEGMFIILGSTLNLRDPRLPPAAASTLLGCCQEKRLPPPTASLQRNLWLDSHKLKQIVGTSKDDNANKN